MNALQKNPGAVSEPAWRQSPQRVDPLGTLGVRPLTILGVVFALGYAVIETARQWDQVVSPPLAFAALLMIFVAGAKMLWASHPDHAPFTAWAETAVLAAALAASVLEDLSRLGHNELLQDDFGQISLAILLLTMAPYRSAFSLVVGAVLCATVLGAEIVISAPGLAIHVPFAGYVVVVVVPPLALGAAAASFSAGLVRSVQQWQRYVARSVLSTEASSQVGVARSVQQQQITLLSEEVLPFLLRVLSTQTVDEEDPLRARALAQSLRGVLIAEIGRTWLDDVLEPIKLVGGGSPVVEDPDLQALGMDGEQRAACAALATAICELRDLSATEVTVRLSITGAERARVRITARVAEGRRPREIKHAIVQYLAVVRVVFRGVRCTIEGNMLTVGFDYVTS
ncbi:MAG: hypothetical protein ABWY36_06580 [Leifsonia sp.]